MQIWKDYFGGYWVIDQYGHELECFKTWEEANEYIIQARENA